MDARLQNLAWTATMALIVEGTSNVSKQSKQVIMARLANVLTVLQMAFFIGYEQFTYSEDSRVAFYVVGQLCAVAADISLFYLLFHLANLFNVLEFNFIFYGSRLLMLIAVPLELTYKAFACVYYVSLLYRLGYTNQLLSILKGIWAVLFFLFALMHLTSVIVNMWGQRNKALFWTMVFRTTRSVLVIMTLAIVLLICGFPPIGNIPYIAPNLTNVVGNSVC